MTSELGATSQRVLQDQRAKPAGKLTWIPDILKWAQSAPAQRSTAHPTPQNVLREPRGPSKAGGARTRKTTLPKGSQGDEASSDHYLPIRVDCDHRSKLSGGEEASPAPPTHPPRQRAGLSGRSAGLRGGAWRGAERARSSLLPARPQPYPLPAEPIAGAAPLRAARAGAAPSPPCPAPRCSAQPRAGNSAPRRLRRALRAI